MSRIKIPIRDRFHEIEFSDGGKRIFCSFCCFMQTLRKRKKAFSGTQSPKCGALAPALVHRPIPQKKGAQGQGRCSFRRSLPFYLKRRAVGRLLGVILWQEQKKAAG